MTVRRLAAKDCLQSCGLTSKGLSLCLFELNLTGCETSRLEMERWKILHSAKFCSPVGPSSTPQDGRKTEVKNIFAVQEYSASSSFARKVY